MNISFEITNLTFQFSTRHEPLFQDLSARFYTTTLHSIKGPNGTGKSTLFRILSGTYRADNSIVGTLHYDGHNYQLTEQSLLKNIFYSQVKLVPQHFDTLLVPSLSVHENLRLACLGPYPTLRSLPDYTIPAVARDFIDPLLFTNVNVLSGGQRQILATLMILQKPTRFLLLDEPTAALDTKNAHFIMRFLTILAHELGLTIILTCHDQELINHYNSGFYYVLRDKKLELISL